MKFYRWFLKADPLIDTLIVPPVQKYAGSDEGLAAKTARRREAAASIRQRASAVEAGAPVVSVLKMARRA